MPIFGSPSKLDNVPIGSSTPSSGAFSSLRLANGATVNATLIADANGNITYVKNNLSSTSDPTENDDISTGYDVTSLWLNTVSGKFFRCISAEDGAAVWDDATPTSTEQWVISKPTPTGTGFKGQLYYETNYLYICIADNVWVRAATTSTWE